MRVLLTILLIMVGLTQPASAKEYVYRSPLQASNLLPTAQIYGLPDLQTQLLPANRQFELGLTTQVANTYIEKNAGNESLLLDGEVQKLTLNARYKLNSHADLLIAIPYIAQRSGVMDSLIYNWHDWFGLPQGGRTGDNQDLFEYRYSSDGETLLNNDVESEALGDIRFNLLMSADWLSTDSIWQLSVKAPTGDENKLTGSGNWDLGAGLAWQQDGQSKIGGWSRFAALGIAYLGDSELALSSVQNQFAVNARLGLHWQMLDWLTFSGQLDTHSPLYDSELKSLGSVPFQLTTGFRFHFSTDSFLETTFSEDLNTLTSPDFVVTAALFSAF